VNRRRLEAYFYSRKNLVGSALALGGLAMLFTGVGGWIWLPITAGLYAIGALLVPGERNLELSLGQAHDEAEIRSGLERLVRSLRGKVADDLLSKVIRIQASILATIEAEGGGDVTDPNVYLIRQTALTYLPDAFSTYLQIPRATAENRRVAGGRTPHDVLLEQLDLMDRRLEDVADDIVRHDSDRLLANGRFLAEKFGTSSLHLTGDAPAEAVAAAEPVGQPAAVAEPEAEAERVHERERVH
jgi:hypothetical protein